MNLIEKTNECQSLTQDEEEWLNGQGNLVKEILLLEKIKSLDNKTTMILDPEDVRGLKNICKFVPDKEKKTMIKTKN